MDFGGHRGVDRDPLDGPGTLSAASCATRRLSARSKTQLVPSRLRQWHQGPKRMREGVLEKNSCGEELEIRIVDQRCTTPLIGQPVIWLEQ